MDGKGAKNFEKYAFLQVAQAVSTRVDILSPEYLIEIERLQDDVAPFPTVQVHSILRYPENDPDSIVMRVHT